MPTDEPGRFLPLTDLAFSILVALSEAPLHGYALLKELRTRTGRAGLRTGTVYAAISRLEDDGLVAEVEAPTESRRKLYRTTELGIAVATAEARRLREQLEFADARLARG